MNNNIGIYKLTSPDGQVYIGQSANLENRKRRFFNGNERSFIKQYPALVDATKEYPRELWKHEILCTCPKSALDVCERFYIKEYSTTNPELGYNIMSGGVRGGSHSEKTKRKISENNGRPWLGKKISEEAKRKISKSNKGRAVSLETRRKLSEATRGEKHPMYGRFGANNPSSKPVNQYTKYGDFVKRWESIEVAANALGFDQSGISRCCNGKQKTAAGGFRWAHANTDK